MIRAPKFPDPGSDQGAHTVRFSIQPDATIADAVALGYRRNLPTRALLGGGPVRALVTSSNPAVIVDTVKLAEDRSGDLVVRLYESLGTRASTTILVDGEPRDASVTDLLERGDERAPTELTLRPFELVTLRFAGVGR